MKLTDEEKRRRADSVLRIIRDSPGLSAQAIGRRIFRDAILRAIVE